MVKIIYSLWNLQIVSNIKSLKNKGRRLQSWVAEKILNYFPTLNSDDVKSNPMSCNGADVQLSSKAKELFPYAIECKNKETLKGLYKDYLQAQSHGAEEPLLILKSNNQKPLAVISAEHLFQLERKTK